MCFCVRALVYVGVQTGVTVLSLYLFLTRFTILVRTGNSVDYSLAIRLLSLSWLSPLHHEIAWLSTRLERTSAKSPLFLHRSLSPFLFLSRVHVATLRSTQHTHIYKRTHWVSDSLTSCTITITSFPVTIPLPPHMAKTFLMIAIRTVNQIKI